MTNQPTYVFDPRISQHGKEFRVVLEVTDDDSAAMRAHLAKQLNLTFYDVTRPETYSFGTYVIPGYGQWGPILRAVRPEDKTPGLVLELLWVRGRPSDEFIADYAQKVRAALSSLPA